MKATILILLFTLGLLPYGTAQKLRFTFDTAGNQVVRTWICIGCPASRGELKPNVLASQQQDSLMQEVSLASGLLLRIDGSRYRIHLYPPKSTLPAIAGFSLSDRDDHTVLSGGSTVDQLDMSGLSRGTYLLRLTYRDGKREEVGIEKI